MIIQRIKGCTRELGKPQGDIGNIECKTLPILDVNVDGLPCMISEWIPDSHELEALRRGGTIRLAIFGTGHPMVSLFVHKEDA